MRTVGAVVRGIRTPIVREGDDLVTLVRDSVMAASETEHITFHDRDIVAVTESVVAPRRRQLCDGAEHCR